MITQKQIDRVKELKAEGLSYPVIAERMELMRSQVERICQGRARPVRSDLKWTPEIVSAWRNLRREGKKLKEIAAQYGTSPSVIGQKLSEQL